MKQKFGAVLLFGAILAIMLTGVAYMLQDKHPGTEDVYSGHAKEKNGQQIKTHTPTWEKMIRFLVRI
jgi:hypothetical protein